MFEQVVGSFPSAVAGAVGDQFDRHVPGWLCVGLTAPCRRDGLHSWSVRPDQRARITSAWLLGSGHRDVPVQACGLQIRVEGRGKPELHADSAYRPEQSSFAQRQPLDVSAGRVLRLGVGPFARDEQVSPEQFVVAATEAGHGCSASRDRETIAHLRHSSKRVSPARTEVTPIGAWRAVRGTFPI